MAEPRYGRETITKPSVTVTTEPEKGSGKTGNLSIKLRKRISTKKVEWSTDTVDNEQMGRRSCKCCCIYRKPRAFGESSTESEDEHDESCGHTHCVRGHRKGRRWSPADQPPTPLPGSSQPPHDPDPGKH